MADSLFLEKLNERIYDHLSTHAIFEEQVIIVQKLIKKHKLGPQWLDTLEQHKTMLFSVLMDEDTDDIYSDELGLFIIDTLKLPFDEKVIESDYGEMSKDFNSRLQFMSQANEGKFGHVIEMPWEVIESNADSVSDNALHWSPPIIKLLIDDYTMYAVARKMNYWAVIVSAIVLLFSMVFLIRKKS